MADWRNFLRAGLACGAALAVEAADARSQSGPACEPGAVLVVPSLVGPHEAYARAAELAGAAPLRVGRSRRAGEVVRQPVCGGARHPWRGRLEAGPGSAASGLAAGLTPTRLHSAYNSSFPRDYNNGMLWAGRGVSWQLGAGGEARWRWFSGALAPELAWQQNADFETQNVIAAGHSRFIYPGIAPLIDWPQRFGEEAFWTVEPGQSYVRADAFGAAIGVSAENLWWGPAVQYPILLGSTAAGFPHVFAGTSEALATPIGSFDAELIWGRLVESDHFDDDAGNDRRQIAGLRLEYAPRWVPGLTVGFARIANASESAEGLDLSDVLRGILQGPLANRFGQVPGNSIAGVTARLVLPRSGLEIYVDWARDDQSLDVYDLLAQPEHSRGYALGMQKVIVFPESWLLLYGEHATVETSAATFRSGRGETSFYAHGIVRQGHTHRGQLLAAGFGPGSDGQRVGGDLFTRRGMIGGYVERIGHDDNAYYRTWSPLYGFVAHDIEVAAAVHQLIFLGELDLFWEAGYAHRRNRNFIGLDGTNQDFRIDHNWSLSIGLSRR